MFSYKWIIPLMVLFVISCADAPKEETSTTQPSATTQQPAKANTPSNSKISEINFPDGQQPQAAQQPQRKPEPPQNADGVWHYTCPKGCAGGAGKADPCGVCGAILQHNKAYHGTTTVAQPTGGSPIIQNTTSGNQPVIQPPSQANPAPAQNAAGVWHYTCAKGCAGGSGAKGNCGKCGGALAHNKAYHDK